MLLLTASTRRRRATPRDSLVPGAALFKRQCNAPPRPSAINGPFESAEALTVTWRTERQTVMRVGEDQAIHT